MSSLSVDAKDTIKLVRELNLLDEEATRLLEQLFMSRSDDELVNSLIIGKSESIVATLIAVCSHAHTPHILGYTLRFFADLVYCNKNLARQLGRSDLTGQQGVRPAELFLQFVTTNSEKSGITDPAIYLASVALRYGDYNMNKDVFKAFFARARTTFSADTLQVADVQFTVQGCVQIAHCKSLRKIFFEENMVHFIPRLLIDVISTDSASIIQLIYETLLLTWLLSFEYEGIVQLAQEKIISQLHRVLQRVQKEKCVRVALMTLYNMVQAEHRYLNVALNATTNEWFDNTIYVLGRLRTDKQSSYNKGPALIAEMVSVGTLKTLNQLCRRKFGDEDITVLVEELNDELEKSMDTLTSFSEYRGEVLTGRLEWTPIHTSAKFWRENAAQFEDNNYEVLNALAKIIVDTRDDVTLAVACHDLGEVIRYHPTGRNLLTLSSLAGVKEKVMTLMNSPNHEVAKQALLCTQKIMVQRWEYMPK